MKKQDKIKIKPWEGIVKPKNKMDNKQTWMSFSEALEYIKTGKKVQRKNWNGKGMYIYLQEGSLLSVEARNPVLQKEIDSRDNRTVQIGAHIDMRAADGTIVIGWLASQTDLLSNDWQLVE
jgi:hypothetical protein